MDAKLQQSLDAITEDEIIQGFRVKFLPPEIQRALHEAAVLVPGLKVFPAVRFTKLTPRKRRLANEATVKRYHADLKNADLLSMEQLRRLNIERGEWSLEQEQRMKQLQHETAAMMRDLYLDGVDRRDQWTQELLNRVARWRAQLRAPATPEGLSLTVTQQDEVELVFDRWLAYNEANKADYDIRYAPLQQRDVYSVDRDYEYLCEHQPSLEGIDLLAEIDELKDRLTRYVQLIEKRSALVEMQIKEARMYAESVEKRRDTADELARLYYCTEAMDAEGNPTGPIAKTFDDLWDLPEEVIQWMLVEVYFFLNNVPDEAREYLAEWGFLGAPRPASTSPQPSDASDAEPNSKPASVPAAPMAAASSELTEAAS
jgi:hypothetical protein